MPSALLDTAVKLAAAGMSGVCIFMALWSGYMISRLSDNASREKYRTVRQFMWICVVLALIAGSSGVANAYFNRDKIELARDEKVAAENVALTATTHAKEAQAAVAAANVKLTTVSQLLAQRDYQQAAQTVENAKREIVLKPLPAQLLRSPDQLFKNQPR
jgi:formate hydrogenlyase subunit 3/multisubunit Na+/H+ antiporter MnhD subunit